MSKRQAPDDGPQLETFLALQEAIAAAVADIYGEDTLAWGVTVLSDAAGAHPENYGRPPEIHSITAGWTSTQEYVGALETAKMKQLEPDTDVAMLERIFNE